jgi:hypothetical protein
MKPGRECPEEERPPRMSDGVCGGVEMEAFNARYLGGSIRVTLGVRGVLMGDWLTMVILM